MNTAVILQIATIFLLFFFTLILYRLAKEINSLRESQEKINEAWYNERKDLYDRLMSKNIYEYRAKPSETKSPRNFIREKKDEAIRRQASESVEL